MSRKDTALKYFNEHGDFMKNTVESNIEIYRKGDVTLKFVTKGKPLSMDEVWEALNNTKMNEEEDKRLCKDRLTVEIKQKNHEFRYGANVFMLDQFETAEKSAAYREKFSKICNIATLPFYWADLEPVQGVLRFEKDSLPKMYRRPTPDLCLEYCAEKGIEPKVHCINYGIPLWLKDCSVEKNKRLLDKHMATLAERYADKIPSWEVVNEMNCGHTYSKFYYEDDYVEWSFKTADKYFPNNRLIINEEASFVFDEEASNRIAYYMQIERLKQNGVYHLDSVGMQFHNFFPVEDEEKRAYRRYNPVKIYGVLDRFAKLGKPLQLTEATVPAYSGGEEDEYVQAELVKNLYKTFFSHPAMEAIVYWNLVDGYAAAAPLGDMTKGENIYYGGFLRHDLSEKPVFKAVDELFNKEYRTNANVATENGFVKFRGFYGDYDITVCQGDKKVTKTISVSKDSDNNFTIEL